jgi:1-acyl-sn-glycerol-3-phosphate acyltransferase
MKPFMEGTGLLAKKLGVQIVPAKIDGLHEIRKQRKHFARRGEIKVTIGAPVSFSRDDDPERITAELQRLVASL